MSDRASKEHYQSTGGELLDTKDKRREFLTKVIEGCRAKLSSLVSDFPGCSVIFLYEEDTPFLVTNVVFLQDDVEVGRLQVTEDSLKLNLSFVEQGNTSDLYSPVRLSVILPGKPASLINDRIDLLLLRNEQNQSGRDKFIEALKHFLKNNPKERTYTMNRAEGPVVIERAKSLEELQSLHNQLTTERDGLQKRLYLAEDALRAKGNGFYEVKESDAPQEFLQVAQLKLELAELDLQILGTQKTIYEREATDYNMNGNIQEYNRIRNELLPDLDTKKLFVLEQINERRRRVGDLKLNISAGVYRSNANSSYGKAAPVAITLLALISSVFNVYFVSGGADRYAGVEENRQSAYMQRHKLSPQSAGASGNCSVESLAVQSAQYDLDNTDEGILNRDFDAYYQAYLDASDNYQNCMTYYNWNSGWRTAD